MRHLAYGFVIGGKIAVADFVCTTERARQEFDPDFTVWMDTIDEGRFEDTNKMFEKPTSCSYHVKQWFDDTHAQLLQVVKRWMEQNELGA